MSELLDQLIVQLRRDEGEVLHAYKDTLGFWTIGVGRLIDEQRGGGISKAESAMLLENDIDAKTRELQRRLPWVGGLSPAREGVLINMAFQLGVDGLLGFKNMLTMIGQRQYDKAAAAMLNSKWAQQTPERAHRLAEQIRTDTWR